MPEIHRRAAQHADDLSFMQTRTPKGSGIHYWQVETTGNYSADWEKGLALGREYLGYLGSHPTYGNANLLGWIVGDMVAQRDGKLTGIELGFLRQVNERAMILSAWAKTQKGAAA
ncbi:hypothetical protein NKH72_13475 [Mesorhizobium sp. M0955]|uniref:hypothetical protein n=1 Tax=Mesorhizobium sp. M0955 TaxID=2957033 RepID=UPI00333C71E1